MPVYLRDCAYIAPYIVSDYMLKCDRIRQDVLHRTYMTVPAANQTITCGQTTTQNRKLRRIEDVRQFLRDWLVKNVRRFINGPAKANAMVRAHAANAQQGMESEDYEDVICYVYLTLGLRAIDPDPTRPLCVTSSNKHQTSH